MITANFELQRERVLLRHFRLEDADDVFAYARVPEICSKLGWARHRSLDDTRRFLSRVAAGCLRSRVALAIQNVDSGRVVGYAELRIRDHLRKVGEIGMALAPEYWGRGYNVEAGELLLELGFGVLRLWRIEGRCDVGNWRSRRTMEKLGMLRERIVARRRGDSCLYGILWREWLRRRSAKTGAPAESRLGSSGAPPAG